MGFEVRKHWLGTLTLSGVGSYKMYVMKSTSHGCWERPE